MCVQLFWALWFVLLIDVQYFLFPEALIKFEFRNCHAFVGLLW